jgi:alkylated DNA repair protein alkB family protein 6
MSLDAHLLQTPLPSAYVIEDYVTPQEEAYLLQKIEQVGGTEIDAASDGTRAFKGKATGWKEVHGRRLMQWVSSQLS